MDETGSEAAAGLAAGDAVRINTDDPALEDVNGMTGRIVHCAEPNVGTDAGGSDLLSGGCLVELDGTPAEEQPRRVWVTIDKLIRL